MTFFWNRDCPLRLLACAFALLAYACARGIPVLDSDPVPEKVEQEGWFVSPENGSDDNNGRSAAFPLRSVDLAISKVKPGETVYLMPGEYYAKEWARDVIELRKENSGREDAYVTICAQDPSNPPIIRPTGKGVWDAVAVSASYVIIDGLEVKGDNAVIDSLEAYNSYLVHHQRTLDPSVPVDWRVTAQYNANGIACGPIDQEDYIPHHIIVRNCKVHDCPGGGFTAIGCDYVTMENNLSWNNAWYNMYGCSGFSYMHSLDVDANVTDFKMILRGNTSYNNHCKIPWYKMGYLSDGNGFIIDVHREFGYKGRILVENNLSYHNGGSGIHTFKADHVTIVNNTAWDNTQRFDDGKWAEIWTNNSDDVLIANNIMYARKGGLCNLDKRESDTFRNNVYYGGKVVYMGQDDIVADPLFKNARLSLEADFRLQSASPAISHGTAEVYHPTVDHDGVSRTGGIDCGAFQSVR